MEETKKNDFNVNEELIEFEKFESRNKMWRTVLICVTAIIVAGIISFTIIKVIHSNSTKDHNEFEKQCYSQNDSL